MDLYVGVDSFFQACESGQENSLEDLLKRCIWTIAGTLFILILIDSLHMRILTKGIAYEMPAMSV